jgi:hypothetical protein
MENYFKRVVVIEDKLENMFGSLTVTLRQSNIVKKMLISMYAVKDAVRNKDLEQTNLVVGYAWDALQESEKLFSDNSLFSAAFDAVHEAFSVIKSNIK